MRRLFVAIFGLFMANAALGIQAPDYKKTFENLDACFLLYDVKADKMIVEWNAKRCGVRRPACSTFKFPLAVMGFDSGVIKDENTPYKWDGKKSSIESHNQDQTAATWMKYSVVWVSQILTPQIGEKNLKKYLADFKYGTQDLSGGLKTAWLTSTPTEKGIKSTLQISPLEQMDFMRRFWKGDLRVSPQAIDLAKKITYIETSPKGYVLHGKTGSGFLGESSKMRLGWFVSHLQKGNEEYIGIISFDEVKDRKDLEGYGGLIAREQIKSFYKTLGYW